MKKPKGPGRGGYRENSGRPSLYGIRTKPIRVPEDLELWILDNMDRIRLLKDGKAVLVDVQDELKSMEYLEQTSEELGILLEPYDPEE